MFCQLLHRIDPDQNMARYYRVEALSDLFGAVIVERRWGRIGSRGQFRQTTYASAPLAEVAASKWIKVKERRGYRSPGPGGASS
ncbi:WGR domain-containing protein [Cypionkella sp.]|uniref:WGR domain-containing protein n=1 Tax=Cypionkella sp. TaxID=2811411 RepID=UPI00271ADE02|nr:WGR domain-containing protein [Cypionkella sp.]MDO8986347.1 WGR domain-containing protein [Cypionkella sp.]MDP2050048.1 WGR domain-containing protein [Cypionkella sp.]